MKCTSRQKGVTLTVCALLAIAGLLCRNTDSNSKSHTTSDFIRQEMEKGKKPNKLINEKSPYLLQHAFNPVEWYPWGEEAFEKARREQKPIFLSVGYSTCHWCHVMERESFEVDSIASIMNEFFVCIKVDREERPDVDKVYMTALQAMGQNGGWPMSMFLTPDLKPFYGGTYFPPENRYGRIGFPEVLRRLHEVWEKERDKVVESADSLTKHLSDGFSTVAKGTVPDKNSMDTCFAQFVRNYDPRFGGFGDGPKFPRPAVFNFLLRYYHRTTDAKALEMVQQSLRKMSVGGVYDHVGGGFHRYSVDGEWRVPHFEKMLYDQAQLVNSYVDLYLITKDSYYAATIRDVLSYVLRDMTDPAGGFYSAEDADSPKPEQTEEEGEGAFYIWSKKEVVEIIGTDVGELFCHYYGIEDAGNALVDPQHEFTGKNILYVAHSLTETAKKFGRTEPEAAQALNIARKTLFQARTKRPRPHLDDKILTSWNGLMISAFAHAYQALRVPEYLNTAERSATFILSKLYDTKTRTLTRRYRDGEARYEAHLDDYAFLTQGLLDLYEASLDIRWLQSAIEITGKQIELFWDQKDGGFFDTSGKDSSILVRMKEQYDGAEPTGNSIAVMNLLRLSQITDNQDWSKKAREALALFSPLLDKQPSTMPQMVATLDFSLSKPKQIVIAGRKDDPETQAILNDVFDRYLPNKIILFADGGEQQKVLSTYLPFVATMSMVRGKATAYICEDYVCQLPTSDRGKIAQLLGK